MGDEREKPVVDIHYIKSSAFREVSCDGAVGGMTPKNKLWMGFYSERLPVPKVARHALKYGDRPGEFLMDTETPATTIDGRNGIVRNLEFGLYLTLDDARALLTWLDGQIRSTEESK